MKRHFITIIIVLAAVCGIWAQETFTLRGKVYDFKTRTELPGATVQLMRTDSTVVTTTTAIEHWLKRRRIIRRLTGLATARSSTAHSLRTKISPTRTSAKSWTSSTKAIPEI